MSTVESIARRSEERFSRNAETDLVCRLLLEKKYQICRRDCAMRALRDARCLQVQFLGFGRYALRVPSCNILGHRWWSDVTAWLFSFFFYDAATSDIYTLSLHDALPILNLIHCSP